MALHPNFPDSPYVILDPALRWFPADEALREQANAIDGLDSPYKAIISMMVLKEGWDVRNVTTIVGLRAYSAQSNC